MSRSSTRREPGSLVVRTHPCPVAAHLGVTPSARLVAADVDEDPSAPFAWALLESLDIVGCQQSSGRGGNLPQGNVQGLTTTPTRLEPTRARGDELDVGHRVGQRTVEGSHLPTGGGSLAATSEKMRKSVSRRSIACPRIARALRGCAIPRWPGDRRQAASRRARRSARDRRTTSTARPGHRCAARARC